MRNGSRSDQRRNGPDFCRLVSHEGLTWDVFPQLFTDRGLGLAAIGLIKGLYPLLWGFGQVYTGHLADRIGRKPLIVIGMLLQALGFALALVLLSWPLLAGIASAIALGWAPRWSTRR